VEEAKKINIKNRLYTKKTLMLLITPRMKAESTLTSSVCR